MSSRLHVGWSAVFRLVAAVALGISASPVATAEPGLSELEVGLRELAGDLAEAMQDRQVRRLAVVDFSDIRGYASALEPFIAEELVTQLYAVSPGTFEVVERRQLARVLAEQKVSSSSLFDQDTIAEIGRLLGIDAVVTGTLAELGEWVKINGRVVSVATAQIFGAASVRVPKEGVVESLLAQTATPREAVESKVARSRRGVQASDVFFQNQDLRLTVNSISINENKRAVALSVTLENLTTVPLVLSLDNQMQACTASLTDSAGNLLRGQHASGIPCSYDSERKRGEGFTTFAPSSRSVIVFQFELRDRGEVQGPLFSFGAEFVRLVDGEQRRFSAGIANIEIL